MAASFYISDGTDTINFLTGNLELRAGGWKTEAVDEEFIWESIKLISDVVDSSARSDMVTLGKLIHRARAYALDSKNSTAVWLYFNADGESAKRSLILNGSMEVDTDEIYSPLMGVDSIKVTLAVKRKPFWENSSATNTSTSGLSPTGGTWLIGNNSGDIDQRIGRAFFSWATASKQEFWAGIRPVYSGTTDFDPVWECEDGTNHRADTTDVVDAGASGGYVVRCTFSDTADLVKRFSIDLDEVAPAADATDFIGRYHVLGRLKLDAGTTQVRVQLRVGFGASGDYHDHDTIVQDTMVDGETSYFLYDLGEVEFPPVSNRDGYSDDMLGNASLTVWLERLSASGSIDTDVLILIPAEHFVYGDTYNVAMDELRVYVTPFEDGYAIAEDLGDYYEADHNLINWKYPQGGGLMVVAAQGATHTLTGTVGVDLYLHPRWLTYRA